MPQLVAQRVETHATACRSTSRNTCHSLSFNKSIVSELLIVVYLQRSEGDSFSGSSLAQQSIYRQFIYSDTQLQDCKIKREYPTVAISISFSDYLNSK